MFISWFSSFQYIILIHAVSLLPYSYQVHALSSQLASFWTQFFWFFLFFNLLSLSPKLQLLWYNIYDNCLNWRGPICWNCWILQYWAAIQGLISKCWIFYFILFILVFFYTLKWNWENPPGKFSLWWYIVLQLGVHLLLRVEI